MLSTLSLCKLLACTTSMLSQFPLKGAKGQVLLHGASIMQQRGPEHILFTSGKVCGSQLSGELIHKEGVTLCVCRAQSSHTHKVQTPLVSSTELRMRVWA